MYAQTESSTLRHIVAAAAHRGAILLNIIVLAMQAGPAAISAAQVSQPAVISVSGGILGLDGTRNFDGSLRERQFPLLFSWSSEENEGFFLRGQSWPAGSTVEIHIVGPQNQAGVTPRDRRWISVKADTNGNLTLNGVLIPFGDFSVDPPDIWRPGNYQVYAIKPSPLPGIIPSIVATSPKNINICPMTLPPYKSFLPGSLGDWMGIDWPNSRGARTGPLGDHSPELTDPEWLSVWSEQPVALYATVAPSDSDGGNQPAHVAYHEVPWTHYAHDMNLELVPDPNYQWVLGNVNLSSFDDELVPLGRIEWEWETQNNGSPFSYGEGKAGIATGKIGLPLWATPSEGDRVFTVGRWAMDNGHPGEGLRTEIHPARMIAAIRKRNTAVKVPAFSVLTRASQVDIYVSGHGGGANQYPDNVSQLLNNAGAGGGRFEDILQGAPYNTYFAQGPANAQTIAHLIDYVNDVLSFFGFGTLPSFDGVQPVAGPSGLGWPNGPEFRPVNDMDYDFDVPLPAPPPGATKPLAVVTTHIEHSTAVKEQITYTNPVAGLPRVAHIHLPYKNADNGIYGRTIKFYWDKFSPPGEHYVVQVNDINNTDPDDDHIRSWNLFGDVCGQWLYLPGPGPGDEASGFASQNGQQITGGGLSAAKFDVFLDSRDPLRVFVQGYERHSLDFLFGFGPGNLVANQTQLPAYVAGVNLAENIALSDGDNVDLKGALFEGTVFPLGSHRTHASPDGQGRSLFSVDWTVSHVNSPQRAQIIGAPVDFGPVCVGSSADRVITVHNAGETTLTFQGATAAGDGLSVLPFPPGTSFFIAPGGNLSVVVRYTPAGPGANLGSITISTNDPTQPVSTFGLMGSGGHAAINASANTARTPSIVVGATTTWPVTITNKGTCTLTVTPSITGDGFSVLMPFINPAFPVLGRKTSLSIAPGATDAEMTVVFTCPSVATKFVGTLTLSSNDPVNPTTTLFFGAEGVPVGMRVLVVRPDGTPYASVDDIKLENPAKRINTHLRDVPLTTIDPPASWKRIRYHYMTALPPSGDGSTYTLRVQVGSKKQTTTFHLAAGEFNQLIVTLP